MSRRLQKRFTAFTSSDAEMEGVAKIMKSELISNYKQGLGADGNPFPVLKNSTINSRGQIARYNRTLGRFSAYLSNITITGEFVRSFRTLAVKTPILKLRRFEMFFTGVHKGYKGADGERGNAVDNSTIHGNLKSLGYDLTGVTKKAQNRIKTRFIRFIKRKKK